MNVSLDIDRIAGIRTRKLHPYIGLVFNYQGQSAEVVRIVGWYGDTSNGCAPGMDRMGGAIVNVYLERSQRFAGHVYLSHELAQSILARRERGQAA